MYRDLPGGPLLVKFADEVSLWCLCSKCGMFSKDMFQDSASHVFCSVCIFECSAQKRIHCKHERRDVPVDDMVQAVDVGHVMRDQIVFCPNSKDGIRCAEFCALKDLEGHYLKCAKTEIICLQCGDAIKGPDWECHIRSCPQEILQCRHCVVAVPRRLLQAHEQLCYGNPETTHTPENTAPVSDSSNSCSNPPPRQESKANTDSAQGNAVPANETQLFRNDVASDDILVQCVHCKRNVKRKNMEQHVQKCPQNKALSAVSTVTKLPGNVEIAPPSRNTPIALPNDLTGEATALQSSFAPSGPHWIAPDSRNTPTEGPNGFPGEATTTQDSFASWDSQWEEISWTHFAEPAHVTWIPPTCATPTDIGDTAQQVPPLRSISDLPGAVVSAVTSIPTALASTFEGVKNFVCGSSTTKPETQQYEECPPPWPVKPSYQKVSEWIEQHDWWLQRNGITNELTKFLVLLNKMPKNFGGTFVNIRYEPNPYTTAKARVLHFFKNKVPE